MLKYCSRLTHQNSHLLFAEKPSEQTGDSKTHVVESVKEEYTATLSPSNSTSTD